MKPINHNQKLIDDLTTGEAYEKFINRMYEIQRQMMDGAIRRMAEKEEQLRKIEHDVDFAKKIEDL